MIAKLLITPARRIQLIASSMRRARSSSTCSNASLIRESPSTASALPIQIRTTTKTGAYDVAAQSAEQQRAGVARINTPVATGAEINDRCRRADTNTALAAAVTPIMKLLVAVETLIGNPIAKSTPGLSSTGSNPQQAAHYPRDVHQHESEWCRA